MGRRTDGFSRDDVTVLWLTANHADRKKMTIGEKEAADRRGGPRSPFAQQTLGSDDRVKVAGLLEYLRKEFDSLKTADERKRFIDNAIGAGVAGDRLRNMEFVVAFTKLLAAFKRTPRQIAAGLEAFSAANETRNTNVEEQRRRRKAAEEAAVAERMGIFELAEVEYLRNIVNVLETRKRRLEEGCRSGQEKGPLDGCFGARTDEEGDVTLCDVLPFLEWEFKSFGSMEERRRFIGVAKRYHDLKAGKKGWWEEARRLLIIFMKLLAHFGHAGGDVARGVETFAMSVGTSEGQKEQVVFETITSLPYGVTMRPNLDAASVMDVLDGGLYGMKEVKDQIRWEIVLAAHAEGAPTPAPFLLVGPPGTGKTSIAQVLARALGVPFFKVSFSGNADIIALKGSNYGWNSSVPGIFVRSLVHAGCLNPVILLDEVDKTGRYGSSGDVVTVLTELLDVGQSARFSDQFLAGIPIDMSKAFFMATANDISLVPQFILDRCRVIEVPLYGEKDRRVIIRDYVSRQVRAQRRLPFTIEVSDDVAARIAAETDSLRVAKEMLTVLLARELEGMTGTPDRVVLNRWESAVADRFLRKGNKGRTIGFGVPSTPVAM